MFCEWPACLALDSTTVVHFILGCVKRLFHRPLKVYYNKTLLNLVI